ncbi:hypothetical protein TGAMA5MH_03982 [Trichoderma gamsii]|uniref:Rho-GAP domain-containing protein n=1 Tax=Trichoderma gamsii TaxID=398673 RepID=A0A2K0TFS8_9HYPO|nr:hypothetical protein TGAMA5MH_03982 [Trichoderma gamsii]
MDPQFPPSASQPLCRSYSSQREMMRRASLRQALQQPAPISEARAIPLDPEAQALLGIAPWPSGRTWTPATETPDFLSENNQDEAQAAFGEEYSNLAEGNGLPLLVVGDTVLIHLEIPEPQQPGLLHRIFSGPSRPDTASRGLNRRSIADLAYDRRYKPDVYTPIDLASLELLTSKSLLRLHPDYAPFPLAIPTCLRACAQAIAEKANTRGIFRVSGSERVVEEFSRYYDPHSTHQATALGTVRANTLPAHITHTIHDVASTFKRFLSRLPGGVLASPTLFNAFVAIHEKLDGPSELPSAYRTWLRARLVALAIDSIKSKSIRHVICAVFGLLNMIGRITELSPEESVDGRPLHPDQQFLDYKGLGVCIGPLLTNDPPLKPVQPTSGRLPLSWSSKLLRRRTQMAIDDDKARDAKAGEAIVKRAMVAAAVAEMLITHWRDVVHQLKDLNRQARHGAATLHLEYSEMPPLTSDPDIGNLLVDSDVSPEVDSVDSQETLFPATAAAGNGQRAARGGLKTTSLSRQLTRSGAIRRPSGRTSRTSSRSLTETIEPPAEDASDGLTQSVSMDAIPARGSSRYTVHFGVSEMPPAIETEVTKMGSNQRPLADKSLIIVRERLVEEPDPEIIRRPLPARLRGKGKAIKDSLLTHASEMFDCGIQQPRNSFDGSSTLPLQRHATITRPYSPFPPRFPNGETAADDDLSITDMQPRYLIDFARNRVPIVFEQENNEAGASKSTSRGNSSK